VTPVLLLLASLLAASRCIFLLLLCIICLSLCLLYFTTHVIIDIVSLEHIGCVYGRTINVAVIQCWNFMRKSVPKRLELLAPRHSNQRRNVHDQLDSCKPSLHSRLHSTFCNCPALRSLPNFHKRFGERQHVIVGVCCHCIIATQPHSGRKHGQYQIYVLHCGHVYWNDQSLVFHKNYYLLLLLSSAGIWNVVFGVLAMECCRKSMRTRKLLLIWNIPTIYYPLAIFAFFSLLSANFQLSHGISLALGHGHGQAASPISKSNNNNHIKKVEESSAFLNSRLSRQQ